MAYLQEFRTHARPLLGATIGSGVGNSLMAYLMTVFAPHLIRDFGWTRAQFAIVGVAVLGVFLVFPLVGRAADLFGTRKVALVGVIGMPACYFANSVMSGSFLVFCLLTTALVLLSTAASSLTYTRVVAERFVAARGLALTVVTCAPALVGAAAINNHLNSSTAALMISIYATSTVVGRLLCGLALDRFAAHAVAAVSMGIPMIGLILLAMPADTFLVIMIAVMLMGLSVGAETDVVAFLVARYFSVELYSTAFGLVLAGVPLAAAAGSLILAAILGVTNSLVPFLWLSAGSVFAGSLLLLSLGGAPASRVAVASIRE